MEFSFQKSRLAAASAASPPHFLVPVGDSLVADVYFSTQCSIFAVLSAATGQKLYAPSLHHLLLTSGFLFLQLTLLSFAHLRLQPQRVQGVPVV
jgi:hypothetical protein